MRVFKIYDVEEGAYRTRKTRSSAPQSSWDTRASAVRVAGRLGIGKYEVHTFKLERAYEEGTS